MLDTLTQEDWARLRAERHASKDGAQAGLFDGPIAPAATWVNRTYAMIWEIAAGANPVVAFTAFDNIQKITTNNGVTTAAVVPTAMRLGASEVIDSFWNGSVGSHGYLREALTTDERQRLDGWMSWTSGYQGGNLPTDHPYKLVAPVIDAA